MIVKNKILKFLVFSLFMVVFLLFFAGKINGQTSTPKSLTDSDIKEGQEISQKLENKQIKCQSLSGNDFIKLGDYYMDKMLGDSHDSMESQIERFHGKDGLDKVHLSMGKRFSGCFKNEKIPFGMMNAIQDTKGGVPNMMGQWGYGNMMNWGGFGVFSIFGFIYPILITIILVLLAVWLWKQIQKK